MMMLYLSDSLREAQKYRGLLLVHLEVEEGHLVPCWEYVQTVMTTRELFESLQVTYYQYIS
jgi:hypothetical protein